MCLIGHLPFLFLLFQHFLYLDSTRLQQADFRPVFPSLPKGCNYCHTGVLDSLECMHDTTFIHKHMHLLITHSTHPHTRYTVHTYVQVVPSSSLIFHPLYQKNRTNEFGCTRASWVLSQMVLMTCAPAEAAPSFALDW